MHQQFLEAIHERVDGTLGPIRGAELDLHLDQCDECRALLADLERIRDAAGALPALAPPPDVWLRLASAIRRETGTPVASSPHRAYGFLAIAASLTLAVAASLWLLREPSRSPGLDTHAASDAAAVTTPAPAGNADADATVEGVEEEFRLAEQHYQNAIARLEQATKGDESAIDPQTAEMLKKNLLVVDQAISESRAALRAEPASEPARDSLFAAFKRKVSLLQDTIALMNEMRKGNAAGAARIVNES